jgi:hypothetical protein
MGHIILLPVFNATIFFEEWLIIDQLGTLITNKYHFEIEFYRNIT